MSTAAKIFAFIVASVLIGQSYMIYELKNSIETQNNTTQEVQYSAKKASTETAAHINSPADKNKVSSAKKVPSADSSAVYPVQTNYKSDWDPFREFHAMEREFDKVFGKMRSHFANDPFFQEAYSVLPRRSSIDIFSDTSKYTIKIDMPGVESRNIETNVDNNILTVKAEVDEIRENNSTSFISRERYSNRFQRSVYLADDADVSKMQSEYKNGLLTITIPKKRN